MLQLSTDNIEAVKRQLEEIAKHTSSLHLRAERYSQARQFLSVEYEKSEAISKLQQRVVEALNPLRDGMRAKDVERMNEATGLALENFKNYGWNTIGELYRPHLTLTRFAQDQNINNLPLPDIGIFTSDFHKIGLFESGDNGTCIRKIAEFELGA